MMMGALPDMVMWDQFELMNPEEVDRILSAVSPATCRLDVCSTCLMKVVREVTEGDNTFDLKQSPHQEVITLPSQIK